jgi:Holliday junction DNA helicase RuvA
MLHYISWISKAQWDVTYLISNVGFGVRAYYAGQQTQGERFLYPIIDDNHKTIFYYAFDTDAQMERFLEMAKVAWVWPKLAFALSNTNESDLRDAVATMDMKFLQSIPGIGPKLAKRLLVELKDSLTTDDIAKLNIDRALYRDIVSTLTNLGYKTTRVDQILQSCPYELTRTNLGDIMKYIITQIS